MVTPSVVQTARTPLKEQQSKQRRPVSSLPNNNKSSNRRNNNRTDVLDSDDSSDSESNDNDDNNIIMANDDDTARTWPPHARSERDEDRTNEELRRMERMVERRMEKEIESLREMDRHFSGGGSRTAGRRNCHLPQRVLGCLFANAFTVTLTKSRELDICSKCSRTRTKGSGSNKRACGSQMKTL